MRRLKDRSLLFLLVIGVVSAALLAVALVFARGGGDSEAAPPCPGADGRSRELRECLAGPLAFIETPFAVGSGVLLEDGHIVTNAHVIDPYATAEVTFDGGESFADVPVVGVDAFADIAVLGPIETDRAGLRLDPLPDLEDADEPEVFLVGYPGGIESDDPSISLSSGVLSRVRNDDTFGLRYLQTDAAIAGGQSGGALVDGEGRVLGISGLGFAEEFALALSADDVAKSVQRTLEGGDERRVVPSEGEGGTEPLDVTLTASDPSRLLLIPKTDATRDVRITVDSDEDVAVDVSSFEQGPIGANETSQRLAAEFAEEAGGGFGPGFEVPDLDEPTPGTFEFSASGDETVLVLVSRADNDASVTVELDAPFVVVDETRELGPLAVGETVRGVLDGFTFDATYDLELEAGDEIEISMHAGTSDAYFALLAPGEELDPMAEPSGDDGGGGLYDLDPREIVEIDESGTWRLVVGTYDGVVTGYELSVQPVT